jgi:hypothetical protein
MDHDEIPSELQGPLFPAEHDNHLMAIDETPLVAHRENTPPASPTALAHNEIPAELQEPLDGFMAHRLYENDLLAIDQTLLMDPTTFKALPGVASGDASGGISPLRLVSPTNCISSVVRIRRRYNVLWYYIRSSFIMLA